MASWLWGKLDRYTKFIRSHKSKCVLCRFGTAWNRHSYLQKPCCLTHPWTYRVLPYHQRNIQICHQGIGAIKKKKHTNQVCLWQRKICSNQLPQLLVSRLCFAGSGLVLTISKNWRMLTSFLTDFLLWCIHTHNLYNTIFCVQAWVSHNNVSTYYEGV